MPEADLGEISTRAQLGEGEAEPPRAVVGVERRVGSRCIARRSSSVNRSAGARSTAAIASRTHAGGAPWRSRGRQRRHGRYPACSASWGVGKYSTFVARGLRAGQVGRQKIPVVRTATKKTPS
jgi:hypothetical protein